jgi:hypothetical protein
VGAAEHQPHRPAQFFADALAWDPRTCSTGLGSLPVGVIGLWCDHDGTGRREPDASVRAAVGEVGGVDHEQVGGEPFQVPSQLGVPVCVDGDPAAALALQQFASEAAHPGVAERH